MRCACGECRRYPPHTAADRGNCKRERMRLKSLREEVLEANLELVRRGLVLYTFGNASKSRAKKG